MNEFDKDAEGMLPEASVPETAFPETEATEASVAETDVAMQGTVSPNPTFRTRGWIALLVMAAVSALLLGILIGFKAPVADPTDRVMAACHSVVLVDVQGAESNGIGSGVVLTSDGYIATNHHVIKEATSVTVIFTDGTSAEAKVIASSPKDDLALLKVDRYGLTAATFATETCYVGQPVYAIGHPGSALLAWTTTHGIISYVNRELPVHDEEGNITGKRVLLQTDATVNPGNSGGALVNERGEVVGIITSRVETMKDAELEDKNEVTYRSLGFALPGDKALALLKAMIRDGHADGVVSGIFFARPEIAMMYGYVEQGERYEVDNGELQVGSGEIMPTSGIYVIRSDNAPLQAGDIITHLGGHRLDEEDLYESALLAYSPGNTVTLTVYRNGETLELLVVLEENT